MNYQKKVEVISTKESPKNFINKLSILNGSKNLSAGTSQHLYQLENRLNIFMAPVDFLQEYFKTSQYLYQLQNRLKILMALIELIPGNIMECPKKILKT